MSVETCSGAAYPECIEGSNSSKSLLLKSESSSYYFKKELSAIRALLRLLILATLSPKFVLKSG
jgi:hypothetical protein